MPAAESRYDSNAVEQIVKVKPMLNKSVVWINWFCIVVILLTSSGSNNSQAISK